MSQAPRPQTLPPWTCPVRVGRSSRHRPAGPRRRGRSGRECCPGRRPTHQQAPTPGPGRPPCPGTAGPPRRRDVDPPQIGIHADRHTAALDVVLCLALGRTPGDGRNSQQGPELGDEVLRAYRGERVGHPACGALPKPGAGTDGKRPVHTRQTRRPPGGGRRPPARMTTSDPPGRPRRISLRTQTDPWGIQINRAARPVPKRAGSPLPVRHTEGPFNGTPARPKGPRVGQEARRPKKRRSVDSGPAADLRRVAVHVTGTRADLFLHARRPRNAA